MSRVGLGEGAGLVCVSMGLRSVCAVLVSGLEAGTPRGGAFHSVLGDSPSPGGHLLSDPECEPRWAGTHRVKAGW